MQHTTVEASRLSHHILRISLSGIFIAAGLSHLLSPKKAAMRLEDTVFYTILPPLDFLTLLSGLSGALMLLFGLLLAAGLKVRASATVLLSVLLPITVLAQTSGGLLHGPLWKNIALVGGLLYFIINTKNIS